MRRSCYPLKPSTVQVCGVEAEVGKDPYDQQVFLYLKDWVWGFGGETKDEYERESRALGWSVAYYSYVYFILKNYDEVYSVWKQECLKASL